MIYMREKAHDKKPKVQNTFKKNVIDELKSRLCQNVQEKKTRSPLYEQQKNVENSKVTKQPIIQQYKIAKTQPDLKNSTLQQLATKVKQNQKAIEKLSQSQHKNTFQYENKLLRYEINRLSEKNQRLIQEINELKIAEKMKKINDTASRKEKRKLEELKQSYCQTEEEQKGETPIVKLEMLRESIKTPFQIEPKEMKKQSEVLISQINLQLEEKVKILKNLEIEKDYLSDQLMEVEKDYEKLKISLEQAYQQKEKYFSQLQLMKEEQMRLQEQNKIYQAQFSAQQERIELLNKKIQLLKDEKQNFRESSRYVQMPSSTQNVTIQILLKFLKRKQLAKYHQALMELINKYEIRISDLNTNYIQEKTQREQLYNYCRELISMVNTQKHLTVEKMVEQINKYYTKVEQLNQNQIDKLLRKVKCYSIGIDQSQLSNIKMELQEYIVQLQSRLPALSEAYLEDGSSVADSYNVSVQNFQS